jgi:pimeloyl-ACP methyl ester carboxylesterase
VVAPAPVTETAVIDGARIEFRRQGSGDRTAVILHGGHMSARCRFGEESFLEAGCSVLAVSRPGYGRTDPRAGPSAPEFVVRLAALCASLGITDATAVGISLGARSALALAAYAPALVRDVILMCPTSFRPWPDPRARRVALGAFNPLVERLTWGSLHALLRRDPGRYLPRLVADLSTLPGDEVVRRLGVDRQRAVEFLLTCRSGSGFMIDLRPPTDVTDRVTQPVLVLGSRNDGSVSWEHPARLAATLSRAQLTDVPTPSHLLWLGEGSDQTAVAIRQFLGSG